MHTYPPYLRVNPRRVTMDAAVDADTGDVTMSYLELDSRAGRDILKMSAD